MAERHITINKVKEVYLAALHRTTNRKLDITTNRPDKKGNPVYGLMDFDIHNALNHHDVNGHYYQIAVTKDKVVITTMVNDLTAKWVTHGGNKKIVITAKDNRGGHNSNILKKELTEAQLRHCL